MLVFIPSDETAKQWNSVPVVISIQQWNTKFYRDLDFDNFYLFIYTECIQNKISYSMEGFIESW